ncbi:Amine oxidase [Gracilaria domingensis]|nr:Amine oxidase [Gracilaria domingensis]
MAIRDKSKRSGQYLRWSTLLDDTPYIPTPNDKIAIVGAGPAGLHMAYLLVEAGFTNITILESTERAAGKSYTNYTLQPGTAHEFGTCYTIPYKYQELRRCAKNMNYDLQEVPLPERTIKTGYGSGASMSQMQYLVSSKIQKPEFQQIENETVRFLAALAAVSVDMARYVVTYEVLFRKSNMENLMKALSISFETFLKQNGFEDLIPLLSLANTGQGYGYVSQVPAFYGLWWNDSHLMEGFIASSLPNPFGNLPEEPAMILRQGFQKFWEHMIESQNFNIRYNVEIDSMNRSDSGVEILYKSAPAESYDFVIVTSNLKECLEFVNADSTEQRYLGALGNTSNLNTTLVTVDHKYTSRPIITWTPGLSPEVEMDLITARDSHRIFEHYDGVSNPDTPEKDYLMCYQYQAVAGTGDQAHQQQLETALKGNMEAAGYSNIDVLEQKIWPYFTRWDARGLIAGHPVTLMENQGRNRTWFCGASAIFESAHDVMEFNILLVNKVRDQLGMEPIPSQI